MTLRTQNILFFILVCFGGFEVLHLTIRLIAQGNYIGSLGWAGTLLFAQMWIRRL